MVDIQAVIDSLIQLLTTLGVKNTGGGIATILIIVGAIDKLYQLNKQKIKDIMIRVEKEKEDGWTNEEKEKLAIDIFEKELWIKVPFYIRMIPFLKGMVEKWIKWVIKKTCEKSKKYQETAVSLIAEKK